MATGAKAAAFSAFVIVFLRPEFSSAGKIKLVLALLSAASMIVGNVIAISQNNIKRMLAYSSIAHAGYMLAGLAAFNITGKNGVLFYLVAYTFMNIGAFGVLSILERQEEKNLTFDDYAGLGARHPLIAALMSVFMFSLAGIPPFAGFFGKYYVFLAAVQSNLTWLAILGVLMSVVSLYYYMAVLEDAGQPAFVRNDFRGAFLQGNEGSAYEQFVAEQYGRTGRCHFLGIRNGDEACCRNHRLDQRSL